jgi:uncharacterized protein (DUF1684 family)
VDELDLLDWKRRVADLYAAIRAAPDPFDGWSLWRDTRSHLFSGHPQSPVPEGVRAAYDGPHLFDYDPAWRLLAEVLPAERREFELPSSDGQTMVFTRFGLARVGEEIELEVYWLEGYGGGVFLPFADATSGEETYGAGRYLLDTVKGSDLGTDNGRLVLDFNFAYQPSCSYDLRWTCPLAPRANRLSVPVRAGERLAAERPQ